MTTTYNNIPVNNSFVNSTVQSFDVYYYKPLELDSTTYIATVAFFTSRGFNTVSAESIAVIIMKQSKIDGYNPTKILNTLKGLNEVEISALVGEILNFNRHNTSYLGYALAFQSNTHVARNIESLSWNDYSNNPPVLSTTLSTENNYSITDEYGNLLEGD